MKFYRRIKRRIKRRVKKFFERHRRGIFILLVIVVYMVSKREGVNLVEILSEPAGIAALGWLGEKFKIKFDERWWQALTPFAGKAIIWAEQEAVGLYKDLVRKGNKQVEVVSGKTKFDWAVAKVKELKPELSDDQARLLIEQNFPSFIPDTKKLWEGVK